MTQFRLTPPEPIGAVLERVLSEITADAEARAVTLRANGDAARAAELITNRARLSELIRSGYRHTNRSRKP